MELCSLMQKINLDASQNHFYDLRRADNIQTLQTKLYRLMTVTAFTISWFTSHVSI